MYGKILLTIFAISLVLVQLSAASEEIVSNELINQTRRFFFLDHPSTAEDDQSTPTPVVKPSGFIQAVVNLITQVLDVWKLIIEFILIIPKLIPKGIQKLSETLKRIVGFSKPMLTAAHAVVSLTTSGRKTLENGMPLDGSHENSNKTSESDENSNGTSTLEMDTPNSHEDSPNNSNYESSDNIKLPDVVLGGQTKEVNNKFDATENGETTQWKSNYPGKFKILRGEDDPNSESSIEELFWARSFLPSLRRLLSIS